MTNESRQPNPINLDELIAKRLPEDITYAEYRDAAKDPQHPLHDPDNPRHGAYLRAEETLKESAKTTHDATKKMLASVTHAQAQQTDMETVQKLVEPHDGSLNERIKPEIPRWDTSALVQDFTVELNPENTIIGRMELAQKASEKARIEREKLGTERHEELREILLTLSTNAVDQRDELAKMREGQEVGEKWQRAATKWGIVIGALTLVATLVSIGVAV